MNSTSVWTEVPATILQKQSDGPPAVRRPSLNEIQIRAYRIHQKHGAIYGGYNLDEWLEAEHELDEELKEKPPKKKQVQ